MDGSNYQNILIVTENGETMPENQVTYTIVSDQIIQKN